MLASGIKQRGGRRITQPEFTKLGEDRIIGSAIWTGDDGQQREQFEVLTIRDGKIVDMQDCRSRRQAERFAKRH